MGKSRTSFKKGEGGRPKGSKNKNYLDASHWLGLAHEEVQCQKDPEKRFTIVRWATELIMAKVPALPATPGESVGNAMVAQQIINKALEDQKQKMVDQLDADPRTAPDSN